MAEQARTCNLYTQQHRVKKRDQEGDKGDVADISNQKRTSPRDISPDAFPPPRKDWSLNLLSPGATTPRTPSVPSAMDEIAEATLTWVGGDMISG